MFIPKAELVLSILMCFNFVPRRGHLSSPVVQMIGMGLSKTLLMLILPYLAWQIPFSVYIFKKFFDSIPLRAFEAARVDGSTELNTFLKVIIPLVRPATATVLGF